MKRIIIYCAILFCITLSACGPVENILSKHFEFEASDFTVLEEKDTHGGFHGDGSYYLILDCSQNADKARSIVENWTTLPLSENLHIVMYGGEKDGINYGYNFAEEAHWPTIKNGVYKFVDRHSESKNSSDDSDLLDRYSVNFSIAVYDLDSNILYYFEMDT
ncbi:MAG: hypothetical protein E7616_09015 [Ruminococcaceae bacterium]|nr:hypothetical protein [Oscillospiraceae bacterium]